MVAPTNEYYAITAENGGNVVQITKRDGTIEAFDVTKIIRVLQKANSKLENEEKTTYEDILSVANEVYYALDDNQEVTSADIEELVETLLVGNNLVGLTRSYVRGCYDKKKIYHQQELDVDILGIIEEENDEVGQENANKDPAILSTQRDLMAGEISKDIAKRLLFQPQIAEAHDKGVIHIHDIDYIYMRMHNCCLINMEDMLMNGTVISGVQIDRPKSLMTAATVATQISAQVASSQYGGQSINLAHIAPFVDISRQKYRKEIKESAEAVDANLSEEQVNELAETKTRKEIKDSVQTMQYQWSTLSSTNGQTPFITLFMYINDAQEEHKDDLVLLMQEVLKQRIIGVKNEEGIYVSPTFPKLIYVLDENNVTADSEYFWLTELAAACTAKRLVPDYISAKKMLEAKGDIYSPMGCRSFLTSDRDGLGENGSKKYWGRFNAGVVTLNLPHVALSSAGDIDEFWRILDYRMNELIYPALMARHDRLLGTRSDVAPILWQHGALARLKPGETIDHLLFNNYSTLSIGYAGLSEAVRYMTGRSHTHDSAREFGYQIMQGLNDYAQRWKAQTDIEFSVYGTPIESTTAKLAKSLQRDFGEIVGITDKDYITNSYHVPVTEEIDAFTKLEKEASFQDLSPGGAISYVEVPGMQGNIPAVISVLNYIYDHIMYAELNTKSDYCGKCGYTGEIFIVEDDDGKRIWECPNCHNRDQKTMNVVRRVCGYLGEMAKNGANQGRLHEIQERVLHLK